MTERRPPGPELVKWQHARDNQLARERKARILRHPDLAARLADTCNVALWNGYIPAPDPDVPRAPADYRIALEAIAREAKAREDTPAPAPAQSAWDTRDEETWIDRM